MARPKRRKPSRQRAVGYIRVSTEKQARTGISLEHQEDVIRAHCRARGLELVELVVDDGHSAYKQPLARRQAGRRVVELVEAGDVGVVVVLRLDRIFRCIQDTINTTIHWDQLGVALHLLDLGGQSIDTSKPMGRMMMALLGGFAELESYAKAERARDAWEYKRARGERLGSLPPYGYTMSDDGQVVEHEAEQAIIRRIVELRAGGCSARRICARLEEAGVEPRGRAWHRTTVDRILERAA